MIRSIRLRESALDINAQMAAVELSLDRDWIRYRTSVFYASGDKNPRGGTARGFDAIFDNSNFAGGFFSFWNREGIRLTGTGVGLDIGGKSGTRSSVQQDRRAGEFRESRAVALQCRCRHRHHAEAEGLRQFEPDSFRPPSRWSCCCFSAIFTQASARIRGSGCLPPAAFGEHRHYRRR